MAEVKNENRPGKSQAGEPAKSGTKPAEPKVRPSGDSPKPHGDPLRHLIDDQKK